MLAILTCSHRQVPTFSKKKRRRTNSTYPRCLIITTFFHRSAIYCKLRLILRLQEMSSNVSVVLITPTLQAFVGIFEVCRKLHWSSWAWIECSLKLLLYVYISCQRRDPIWKFHWNTVLILILSIRHSLHLNGARQVGDLLKQACSLHITVKSHTKNQMPYLQAYTPPNIVVRIASIMNLSFQ